MYVITNHNMNDFVILGPIDWKSKYISDILSDELDENVTVTKEDETKVPFEPYPGIKIRKCRVVNEIINSKIQVLNGPFWEYDDSNSEYQATATWKAFDKDINTVKLDLKQKVAELRWNKEILGVDAELQNTTVRCDTDRDGRNIFLQKYLLMGETETVNWKFGKGVWLTISKQELGYLIGIIARYVQSCYDWESSKNQLINSCQTLQELDSLSFDD